MKKALITGITGQDGAYLAEFLLNIGYEVHGLRRRTSMFNTARIDHLYEDMHSENARMFLHYGDMADTFSINKIVSEVQPDEIYNLAAQSHVAVSFVQPEYTANVDGIGTLRVLEAVRTAGLAEKTRIYQASTSELFGLVQQVPQTEATPFYPRSPYAVAKMYAYWITVNYREAYNMFAVNGILFNHESPLRGETFVTRKVTRGLSRIKHGLQEALFMGNINSLRDWGHARDYIKMMWLMLQNDKPKDYVISTGEQHSVREFISLVAEKLDMPITWKGDGVDEVGVSSDGREIVRIDPRYYRPSEVDTLLGDSGLAAKELGWVPEVSFDQLVNEMVESDEASAKREKRLNDLGGNERVFRSLDAD